MNDFESRLTTALREEAEEFSMNVDMQDGTETLGERLDKVDRSRRAWYALGAAAAAAAVVAVGLVLAARGSSHDASTPPAASHPAPSASASLHSDPYFHPAFTAVLPDWVVRNNVTAHEEIEYAWWTSCDVPTLCADLSVSRFDNLKIDGLGPKLTYAAFLAHLQGLDTKGTISISRTIPRTVDGRSATEVDADSTAMVANVLGCAGTSCQDIQKDMSMRYVVLDMGPGQTPIVIFDEVAHTHPQKAAWLAQLDTMLESIRFSA